MQTKQRVGKVLQVQIHGFAKMLKWHLLSPTPLCCAVIYDMFLVN